MDTPKNRLKVLVLFLAFGTFLHVAMGQSPDINSLADYCNDTSWHSQPKTTAARICIIIEADNFLNYINTSGIRISMETRNGISFLNTNEMNDYKQIVNSPSSPQSKRNQMMAFNDKVAKRLTACVLELTNTSIPRDSLMVRIEKINYPVTLIYCQRYLRSYIKNLNESDEYKSKLNENLNLLNEALSRLLERDLIDYANSQSSHEIIKGVEVSLLNDLFTPTCVLGITPNLDKNLSGGGELEVRTDLFKMRLHFLSLLAKDRPINLNGDRWYRYQSICLGLDVYTPFIRPAREDGDTIRIFKNQNSINYWDRPFFSYKYIGRKVYRLNLQENVRLSKTLTIGVIGSDAGRGVQALLHRDVTVGSVTPRGWASQIAFGGRYGFQYDSRIDVLLISSGSGVIRDLRPCKPNVNVTAQGELFLGYSLNAVQLGLRYSNKSFAATNGHYMPQGDKNQFLFDVGLNLRYVVRNGTLEGYGFLKDAVDEDPKSPFDIYALSKDRVVPWVALLDLNLGVKIGKSLLYWRSVYYSEEYRLIYADSYDNSTQHNLSRRTHNSGVFLYGEKQEYGYYYGLIGLSCSF